MPIFSITCHDCHAIEEVLLPSASTGTPACSHCGSVRTERMISRAAVCTGGSAGTVCPTGRCPLSNA